MKYIFANNKQYAIKLPDKSGRMIAFAPGERKALDEFFKRYAPKQLTVIKLVDEENNKRSIPVKSVSPRRVRTNNISNKKSITNIKASRVNNQIKRSANRTHVVISNSKGSRRIVGRSGVLGRRNATEFSVSRLQDNSIGISNHIGVGILSFNRLKSLIHLIESIRKHTDLDKTTIFVSDESTDGETWKWLQQQKDIIAFHNPRHGIAVNSNRLLRCLKRFKYKIILNDDIEVLRKGWETFYFEAMDRTGLKHFCYRQEGIYGAIRNKPDNKGVIAVPDKPHGAVMAIHQDAFNKVGFFDESFGIYGFEHVDYSDRIARSCHNCTDHFDMVNSDLYFKIYNDNSSDPDKHKNYNKARERYNSVKSANRTFVDTTDLSIVPGMTCIIPFRDLGRTGCIETVVNNVRTLRYPEVQIILSEQDHRSRINLNRFPCVDHILVKSNSPNQHFCKSSAFNSGVAIAKFNKLILHDADMLVRSDYARKIDNLLNEYESVHIGKSVCYMEKESTDRIIKQQSIGRDNIASDRIVTYYEGGSLAILRDAYIRIGGFCEEFIGYGCEDTEYYNRMIKGTKSYTVRSIDLFHLWHDRTPGWMERHDANKAIQNKMFTENINLLMKRLRIAFNNKYGIK